jgi:squalene-associated FAD-dependent desaturase
VSDRLHDAAVVGGGMAGLACATALAGLGWRVCVIEARAILGGRACSWRDERLGCEVDNGPHLFAGAYREVATLLGRLGMADRLRRTPRLRVPLREAGGRTAVLEWGAAPGVLGLSQGFTRFRVLAATDRARLLAVPLAAWREETGSDAPLGAWLEGLGQTPLARRWLWDPMAKAIFNEEPDRLSARLFATVVRRLFLGGAAGAALSYATGGLSRLYAEPAAAYLEARGSRVRRAVAARAARPAGDAWEIHVDEGEPVRARTVCLAVPPTRALGLLAEGGLRAPAALEAAARLPGAPLITVHLRLAGNEPRLAEPFVGFVDSDFAWCFDRTALGGAEGPGRQLSLVAPGARALLGQRAEAIADAAIDALAAHTGALAERAVTARRVVKEPRAAPSLTPEAAGARPAVRTDHPGLVLAGDWTDTGLPATLEGAAQSGHAAARALHRRLGGTRPW